MSDQSAEGRPEVPWLPTPWRRGLLAALVLAFLAVGLHQAGRDAPTVDEGVDLSSGVASLVHRDHRMVPEHPVLPKAVAALPSLLAGPEVPRTEAWEQGDWFEYSDDFIRANEEAGRLPSLLRWARAVVLVEAVAVAGLLYLLARRWFGPDGGFVVAAAWLTTPYVVGLGHFAMIDLPFTLAVLGTCVLLGRWLDRPAVRTLVPLAVVLGLALATRHTALVLVAVVAGVVLQARWRDRRQAVLDVGLLAVLAVATVWLVYRGLAPSAPGGAAGARLEGTIAAARSTSLPARIVTALPLPLEWRAGFAHLDLTSVDRPSALLGRSWDGARWWYFPASAVLKLPLTLTAAVVAGWVVAVRRPGGRTRLATVVVLPALALWLLLLAQPLNLGLRLALPVVALALVGLGALPGAVRRSPRSLGSVRPAALALGVVAVAQVAAGVAAVPHSLAWTPPPFTPAYRWVSDANLDAGQGLYEVRAWAREHDRPYVALDSTRGLDVGGGARSLRGVDPAEVRGWVAVGVTPLVQTRRGSDVADGGLAWLRRYCPVGTLAGGSVLVYRFDRAPDPSPGPERPAPPCYGDRFSSAG